MQIIIKRDEAITVRPKMVPQSAAAAAYIMVQLRVHVMKLQWPPLRLSLFPPRRGHARRANKLVVARPLRFIRTCRARECLTLIGGAFPA
jgi:hypothetical protein